MIYRKAKPVIKCPDKSEFLMAYIDRVKIKKKIRKLKYTPSTEKELQNLLTVKQSLTNLIEATLLEDKRKKYQKPL